MRIPPPASLLLALTYAPPPSLASAATSSVSRVPGPFRPSALWSTRLPRSGSVSGPGPRRGNGVVPSSYGGAALLWVTDDEGGVHVLDASDGSIVMTFRPPDGPAGTVAECRSSVSLSAAGAGDGSGSEYAVYAVTDVPGPGAAAGSATTSRVVAVDASPPSPGNLRWIATVEGAAAGTPRIGSGGDLVYVTHNSGGRGYLSVLDGRESGRRVAMRTGAREAPYGPAAVVASDGGGGGGGGGGTDAAYWGESGGRGHAESGRVYRAEAGTGFAVEEAGAAPGATAAAVAVVSTDGERGGVWYAGRGATVYGWTGASAGGGDGAAAAPSWSRELDRSRRNETLPLPNRAAPSPDGSRLYVASASTSLHCLDADTGDEVWAANGTAGGGVFLTEAVVSPDGGRVYSIEHGDGAVAARNAGTGEELWRFGCADLDGAHGTCQDSVEAEFGLSADGTALFYADVFGRVTALRVAEPTEAPTAKPTEAPTAKPTEAPTAAPTAVPTAVPTAAPTAVPTAAPTAVPTAAPTAAPSSGPSAGPTPAPSPSSTALPSSDPSAEHTSPHTFGPTPAPTPSPIVLPKSGPSAEPTSPPTFGPTPAPASPAVLPSSGPPPTSAPIPTAMPTASQSEKPTGSPQSPPTSRPTSVPSALPTVSHLNRSTQAQESSNPSSAWRPGRRAAALRAAEAGILLAAMLAL